MSTLDIVISKLLYCFNKLMTSLHWIIFYTETVTRAAANGLVAKLCNISINGIMCRQNNLFAYAWEAICSLSLAISLLQWSISNDLRLSTDAVPAVFVIHNQSENPPSILLSRACRRELNSLVNSWMWNALQGNSYAPSAVVLPLGHS